MTFRSPKDVRAAFHNHPRRALILTTLEYESWAVKAHLVETEVLVGEKDALYECGRFPDPAGDWMIVHAITPQGNSDAGLVASKAHEEFGSFDVQMFVGVAGSLKDDIPIGSVVIGDYVYNAQSVKISDNEILGRNPSLAAARELLNAARGVIHISDWANLIRAPSGRHRDSGQRSPQKGLTGTAWAQSGHSCPNPGLCPDLAAGYRREAPYEY